MFAYMPRPSSHRCRAKLYEFCTAKKFFFRNPWLEHHNLFRSGEKHVKGKKKSENYRRSSLLSKRTHERTQSLNYEPAGGKNAETSPSPHLSPVHVVIIPCGRLERASIQKKRSNNLYQFRCEVCFDDRCWRALLNPRQLISLHEDSP